MHLSSISVGMVVVGSKFFNEAIVLQSSARELPILTAIHLSFKKIILSSNFFK